MQDEIVITLELHGQPLCTCTIDSSIDLDDPEDRARFLGSSLIQSMILDEKGEPATDAPVTARPATIEETAAWRAAFREAVANGLLGPDDWFFHDLRAVAH